MIDLDGVVWLEAEPIPGGAAAIAAVVASGDDVVFVTNSSWSTVARQEERLRAAGIDADGRVLTSAQAAAGLCRPGERAFVVGGPGVREALDERGVTLVDGTEVDVVVVGLDRQLTYDRLATATRAIRAGARFVATNGDVTYPTPEGLLPGAGSIVAALVAATGTSPLVAGKPEAPMCALVRRRLGAHGVVVGDRPDTDGRFAIALGYRFALVLSGVTQRGALPVFPSPDVIADDLAGAVGELLIDPLR